MSINFPSSPTTGQKFDSGSRKYRYDGTAWAVDDYSALFNNLVINPAMNVSQENGITAAPVATSNAWYSADQWLCGWSLPAAAGSATSYVTSIGEGGGIGGPYPCNACTVSSNQALAAPGTNQYSYIYQYIEGRRSAVLKWGTSGAIPAVLRFMAMTHKTGNYAVSIYGTAPVRSWCSSFTITTANTWQEFVIPIPAETTGGWKIDETIGLALNFGGYWGPNYVGVAGWQDGTKYAVPGVTNVWQDGAGYFRIAKVGLYPDPYGTGVAPYWVHPQYAEEELKCMRYWYRGYCLRGTWSNANQGSRMAINHPVNMRVFPGFNMRGTISCYSGAAGGTMTGVYTNYCLDEYAELEISTSGGPFTQGHVACTYMTGVDNYVAINARM